MDGLIVRYDQSIRKESLVSYWQDREPVVNPAVVASIQTTFNRSRLSRQGWQSRLLEGRVDGRQVYRNDAKGALDIFRERNAPTITKVNLWVIIDSSGSMNGTKIDRAQDLAGTLVSAFQRIPSVRLQVWQHNAMGDGDCNLYRVYAPGVNKIKQMRSNVGGGNADGFALQAIGDLALKAGRPDERTIVWMISDGLPSAKGTGSTRHDLANHSTIVCATLRAKGLTIIATAIEGFNKDFVQMYSPEWIMQFKTSIPADKAWIDLGQQTGAIVGRALARK
jgi:hypothetical protein